LGVVHCDCFPELLNAPTRAFAAGTIRVLVAPLGERLSAIAA